MHQTVKKLDSIKNKVKEIITKKQLKTDPQIVVVSKTFEINKVIPMLEAGHIHFGENKVQEAETKWSSIKTKYNNIKLHMVGGLQSNKAKNAIEIFDYIHSLDNEKLANKISKYQNELNKKSKLFIQVNLAKEKKKSGIFLSELRSFFIYCTKELSLNIIGLMCLPPYNFDSNKYFSMLKKNAQDLNLNELSMGMSSDYEQAVINGSTFLRLGTAILGERNPK